MAWIVVFDEPPESIPNWIFFPPKRAYAVLLLYFGQRLQRRPHGLAPAVLRNSGANNVVILGAWRTRIALLAALFSFTAHTTSPYEWGLLCQDSR